MPSICLVSLNNLYLTPYIHSYATALDAEYDVVYWNRHDVEETSDAKNTFSFNMPLNQQASVRQKLAGYLKFRRFVIATFRQNSYDKVIALQTSAAALIWDVLTARFRKRYIIDIRDYTLERNAIFRMLETYLIKNASNVMISSPGYRAFLPEYDYTLVHNDATVPALEKQAFRTRDRNRSPLKISLIGLIRFYEQNTKVIERFANDERFKIRFAGTNANSLASFCEVRNIRNVELIETFPPSSTLDYYRDTDLINNFYGSGSPLLDYALSNKLYYAAALGIPILVSPGTQMQSLAERYGLGRSFDLNDTAVADAIYSYYQSIEWPSFQQGCDAFTEEIRRDNQVFSAVVRRFARGEGG